MLIAVGDYTGPVTGSMTPAMKTSVENFQKANVLNPDGDPGPLTRAKLFAAYMLYLWPSKIAPTDFSAKGADPGLKGDVQGCGEFNPIMVFSKSELASLPKDRRDEENSANRRVMVLLFRPGSVVPPDKWPCPKIGEGTAGCKKRFWSDGEKRRSNQALRREFPITKDTLACRFYDRMVSSSPCEGVVPDVAVLLMLTKLDDHFCPKQEKLDTTYRIKGLSSKSVTDGIGNFESGLESKKQQMSGRSAAW